MMPSMTWLRTRFKLTYDILPDNPGYYGMSEMAKQLIIEWTTNE